MANTSTVVNAFQRYYANDGVTPLGGGSLTFYANKTTTLVSIFTDPALTVSQTNPNYVLDAGGRIQGDVRFAGTVSILIKDSGGGTVRTDDDNTCFSGESSFDTWDAKVTYGSGGTNLVTGSDGLYYVSISTSNLNNDPASGASPTKWSQIKFLGLWNTEQTYVQDDVVQGSDGYLYNSIAGSNTGTNPVSDTANSKWEPAVFVATSARAGIVEFATDAETNTGTATNRVITPANLSQYTGIVDPKRGFIDGLITSQDADTDHDINVADGACIDSTNAVDIVLAAQMTKRIDATWASGDNNGGLASGATLANTTWYHVFAIIVGGSTDIIFDTSVVCANGVANNSVTSFRRIASILTDGSANIVDYVQVSNVFKWAQIISDALASNPGTSALTITLTVPTGVVVEASSAVVSDGPAGPNYGLVSALSQSDNTATTSQFSHAFGSQDNEQVGAPFEELTNTSAQIRLRFSVSGASHNYAVATQGWIDFRGVE